jgi:addiction module RelB/DinJ family antitoxin
MSIPTTVIQTRISKSDKEKIDLICDQVGLTFNDVIRIIAKQIVNTNSIQLDLNIPSLIDEREPDEFEKAALDNHQFHSDLASEDDVKELEKELGIKLRF